jgi:hypothetical protein
MLNQTRVNRLAGLFACGGGPGNSYIGLSDGMTHRLQVPSSGVVDYTIDYDLRQAVTCLPGRRRRPKT